MQRLFVPLPIVLSPERVRTESALVSLGRATLGGGDGGPPPPPPAATGNGAPRAEGAPGAKRVGRGTRLRVRCVGTADCRATE